MKNLYIHLRRFECGTYPDISVAFQPAEVTLTLEGDSMDGRTDYTESGTTPDISVGAQFNEVQVGLEGESGTGSTVYTETGTIPDPSVGFPARKAAFPRLGKVPAMTYIITLTRTNTPRKNRKEFGSMTEASYIPLTAEALEDIKEYIKKLSLMRSTDPAKPGRKSRSKRWKHYRTAASLSM